MIGRKPRDEKVGGTRQFVSNRGTSRRLAEEGEREGRSEKIRQGSECVGKRNASIEQRAQAHRPVEFRFRVSGRPKPR